MRKTKRALALLALALSVGCTTQFTPATPPPIEAVVLRIHSTDDASLLLQSLNSHFSELYPDFTLETTYSNQDTLLENLEQGTIDYFVSHHFPVAQGDLWAAPLAQDAIALVVHPDNPLNNLSSEELRRIYRGYAMNWQDLGGQDLAIALYSRDDGAAIRREFERLVMGQERTSPNALLLPSSSSLLERVSLETNAIAYLPLSLIDESVKILSIDGIAPSFENLRDNRYPLRTTLYIIGLHEPSPEYQLFIAWIQGLEGQAILSDYYAPLPP